MTRTVPFFVVVAATSLVVSFAAMANEEVQAREICQEVMTMVDRDRVDSGQEPVGLAETCNHNTRSPAYWSCTKDRMNNGESFQFAANQCESRDPRRDL